MRSAYMIAPINSPRRPSVAQINRVLRGVVFLSRRLKPGSFYSPCRLSAKPYLLAACFAPHRAFQGQLFHTDQHRAVLRPNGSR